eukprot:Hpha_TRINITY_DN10488_c0_g1::TRINITY_DN10488_c0_g1_i1::g.193284::m.193284
MGAAASLPSSPTTRGAAGGRGGGHAPGCGAEEGPDRRLWMPPAVEEWRSRTHPCYGRPPEEGEHAADSHGTRKGGAVEDTRAGGGPGVVVGASTRRAACGSAAARAPGAEAAPRDPVYYRSSPLRVPATATPHAQLAKKYRN